MGKDGGAIRGEAGAGEASFLVIREAGTRGDTAGARESNSRIDARKVLGFGLESAIVRCEAI